MSYTIHAPVKKKPRDLTVRTLCGILTIPPKASRDIDAVTCLTCKALLQIGEENR